MVQHQYVPRKRRAERSLAPAAQAAIFNVEAEEGRAGDVPLHKRVKEELQLQPPPPSLQVD